MIRKINPIIDHIIDAIETAEIAIKDLDYKQYYHNRVARLATQRAIEITSEATRRLPDKLLEQYPHIEWPKIKAIGNILRHEYHNITDEIIWEIITEKFPDLKVAIIDMKKNITR